MKLFSIMVFDDHFVDIIHFLAMRMEPIDYSVQQKNELVAYIADFTIIFGQLYKLGADEVLQRYVLEHERQAILAEAHGGVVGGHYAGKETA